MKNIARVAAAVLLLLWFIPVAAAEESATNEELFVGGWGGPIVHITNLDGKFCTMWGAYGGVILNDLSIGLFGIASPRSLNTHAIGDANLYYGGLYLGYTIPVGKRIRPHLYFMTGYGGVFELTGPGAWDQQWLGPAWIFIPGLEAEWQIARAFRLGLGFAWRFVSAYRGGYDPARLTNWIIDISFKFGGFPR